MNIRILSFVASVLLVAGVAFAQSPGETVKSVLGMTPSTGDFVEKAAIGDLFEIQSSELALQRGDPATKTLAEHIISGHRKTSQELAELVTSGKVKDTLPTALDSEHQEKLDKLKALQGAEFTKQYLTDLVDGHKEAVSLFERYAAGGDNPALKTWAAKTLPALKSHLEMAEQLEK